MAKFDIGKGLKAALKGATDTAKAAADTAKSAAGAVKSATKDIKIPDIKVPDQVMDVFKKKEASVSETTEANTGEKEEKIQKDARKNDSLVIKAISTKSAIKIIYYLMAADGSIFHNEEEKFDSIGKELDPEFASNKEQIIRECQAQLDKVIDTSDYYDVVQDGVEDALISSMRTADTFITPKLLVWNLLTVAYSDEDYDETERKLLKYIVRKLDIDKSEFLEMESSILTLIDLEKELAWIKTTDRPYLTIEALVNEIQDRKSVIFESVKDLIAL